MFDGRETEPAACELVPRWQVVAVVQTSNPVTAFPGTTSIPEARMKLPAAVN